MHFLLGLVIGLSIGAAAGIVITSMCVMSAHDRKEG